MNRGRRTVNKMYGLKLSIPVDVEEEEEDDGDMK